MMINSGMYKTLQSHQDEPKDDIKKDEHKDDKEHTEHNDNEKEITNVSSESMVDIAKMISSMLESTTQPSDIKCIYAMLHDLDKRVAITEALIKHLFK